MTGTLELVENKKSVGLTPEGICAIIESCAKSGVVQFEFGSLAVKFVGGAKEEVNPWFPQPEPTGASVQGKPTNLREEDLDLSHLSEEERNEMVAELQDYELLTNDPSAYEQKMIDAQLENLGDENAEDDR